mmetsp:Transcript_13475/g.34556  ORF Transcript_13475/g.34556 Transcript_13475/m.34556 type:complete len:103 (-) Transcript_13475:154-462(-)|eukprot:CAMPEP_0174929774 /NCGR_PEP_ID=MMETSP1355-20121228/28637_1 /TAXON_ID=464990 /ORGANISM="Hemiselmis tepida, Strain CCMP443" /LENGTH=102 /DNA_ID=CAMNT_0016176007 /DNA_START=42 /DNA_END=350 /DNA_ORIENTATION=+
MGGSRLGAGGSINKKRVSIVVKKNRDKMLMRKDRLVKQANAPQFSTKTLSKKKARLLLKQTNLNKYSGTHARQTKRRASSAMAVEDEEEQAAPAAKPQKMRQ